MTTDSTSTSSLLVPLSDVTDCAPAPATRVRLADPTDDASRLGDIFALLAERFVALLDVFVPQNEPVELDDEALTQLDALVEKANTEQPEAEWTRETYLNYLVTMTYATTLRDSRARARDTSRDTSRDTLPHLLCSACDKPVVAHCPTCDAGLCAFHLQAHHDLHHDLTCQLGSLMREVETHLPARSDRAD